MYVRIIIVLLFCLLPVALFGQDYPTFKPRAEYAPPPSREEPEPVLIESSYPNNLRLDKPQDAPLSAVFYAEPSDADGWNVSYNWVVEADTALNGNFETMRHIYEPNLEQVFDQKGMYRVRFYASFSKDNIVGEFPSSGQDEAVFVFQVSESRLTFPNTFTPNGDGQNDYFRPMEYQSIVEFHATVFNRWGQKLYSWDDVAADGWDGRIGGSWAKNGAYYFICNAKGSDGTHYRIRKTINVMTNRNPDYNVDSGTGGYGANE